MILWVGRIFRIIPLEDECHAFISISHTKEHVATMVVLEKSSKREDDQNGCRFCTATPM